MPGSYTYGTNDFCVMKYEASQSSATVPISQGGGMPWVSINQTNAITYSANVAGCTGCHLITNAEWMTIAQNVLGVNSNWDNGAGVHTVGTGYIYSGHNDNTPTAGPIATGTNDNDEYINTGNTAPSNQRRVLTLSNGEKIWDLAGNVDEWTSDTIGAGEPGVIGGGYGWREWTIVTAPGSLAVNPFPSGTGITGASTWTGASNGIGQLLSNADSSTTFGLIRSGGYGSGNTAGVLTLNISTPPGISGVMLGFRVAR